MSEVKRILVVDDDLEMNTLLKDFFKRQGYAVSAAASVTGALTYLDSLPPGSSPDLVISDVKMGRTSGMDLTKQLLIERPGLPVILFSVFEGHENEALESGALRFIRKPFELAKLSRIVTDLLGARK